MAEARLYRESDGRWACRPYLGTSAAGRRLRPYRSWPAETPEEEARAEAEAWVATLTSGGRPVPRRLDDALAAYVDDLAARGAAPNTVRNYRQCARNVSMYVGGADPTEVGAADLYEMEGMLLARGGRSGEPMAPDTVRAHHMFLRGAFAWLVRSGARDSNPMLSVTPPAPGEHEAMALDARGLAAVSAWVDGHLPGGPDGPSAHESVMAMVAWLGLRCGLRVGEACGIRPRDLAPGGIRVRGSVHEAHGRPERRGKTKGGRARTVSVTPGEALELAGFEEWQRMRLGRLPDAGPLATEDGPWLSPSAASGWFSSLAAELGLPAGTRFHTLRHTHATWLLLSGVDMRTVSERLGHADVATTMRLYAHVLPGRDAEAAAAFGRALGGLGGRANGVPAARGPHGRADEERARSGCPPEHRSGGSGRNTPNCTEGAPRWT